MKNEVQCKVSRALRPSTTAALAMLVLASCDFDDRTQASEHLKSLYSADVLFIDDLGQSKLSERVRFRVCLKDRVHSQSQNHEMK
jgi:DNA replication protein DnaC